jgi:2'-5' RNA ligase
MARTRTFVGVSLNDPLRQQLAAIQQTLARTGARVHWTQPDALHITVLFLGDLDDQELVKVCQDVDRQTPRFPRFSVAIHGLSGFPTPRRPKILWAGIADGAAELVQMYQHFEQQFVKSIGYRPEERSYSPHVTLGRIKADEAAQQIARELPRYSDHRFGDMPVSEIHVFRSDLRRDGPQYTILARGQLSAQNPGTSDSA